MYTFLDLMYIFDRFGYMYTRMKPLHGQSNKMSVTSKSFLLLLFLLFEFFVHIVRTFKISISFSLNHTFSTVS